MIIDRPALIRNGFFSYALLLLLITILFTLAGCHNFFKVNTVGRTPEERMSSLNDNVQKNKYFILRHGRGNFSMKNITIDQEHQTISFIPDTLPITHQVYTRRSNNNLQYKSGKGEREVLNEVHLFSNTPQAIEVGKTLTLPLNTIEKIQVIEFDSGRTTGSYILGGLGYTLGAFAALTIIVALTKSSCPFVSAYNGESYDLQGELFGGALYPSSERADYVPLKIKPVNGEYIIRISNELEERQYTNFAKLLVVSHDKNVRALTDLQGNIYTVASTIAPIKAVVNEKQDVTTSVIAQDFLFSAFDDTTSKENINSLVLTFNKTSETKRAKLLLQLKNSYWFDYLYGEFNKAFGSYYNKWVKKESKVPASEHDKWSVEQHIPMQVSVKTATGWREVCSIKSIGPLMNREVLIPIYLKEVNGNNLQVRLTTGFMFWELDYAGVDYSPDLPYTLNTLDPYEALDEKGKSVLESLKNDDHLWLDQPYPGKSAVLKYKLERPDSSETTSVILYTKGYYQPVRDYRGKPELAFLREFRKPGAFANFSRQRFETLKHENLFASIKN